MEMAARCRVARLSERDQRVREVLCRHRINLVTDAAVVFARCGPESECGTGAATGNDETNPMITVKNGLTEFNERDVSGESVVASPCYQANSIIANRRYLSMAVILPCSR
jgi:hypothetical protein